MREPVIAHMDLDAFFAAVEQRDNPALRGKSVIIGADPQGGKGRGVVSTCSYEARPFGVRSAMPISIAYKKCPHGVFLPPNFKKYSAASKAVFAILYDFTPDIEQISIDEAFLDCTGCIHLYGSAREMARKIKEAVKQKTGLTASIGIAPVKFVAKIASDYCKPNGLLEVKDGQVKNFLCPLKIERLWGVGPKTQQHLNRLGISTIGQLAKIPLPKLESLFGEHGRHLHELANGIDPRRVNTDQEEAKSISHEHTWDEDIRNVEEVKRVILSISEKLSRRLRKAGLKGRTITVKIRLKGFKTYTRAKSLPENTNYTDVIYETAKEIFAEFNQPEYYIRLIGVRVNNFHDPYVKDSLFAREDSRIESVHRVVDIIKDKYGESAIHRAV